jgi:hypothetical protein
MDELGFWQIVEDAFKNLGFDNEHVSQSLAVIKVLTIYQRWHKAGEEKIKHSIIKDILNDSDVGHFIQINSYKNILWFSKEAFEELMFYMLLVAVIDLMADPRITETERTEEIAGCYSILKQLQLIAEQSGYQVEKMLERLKSQ